MSSRGLALEKNGGSELAWVDIGLGVGAFGDLYFGGQEEPCRSFFGGEKRVREERHHHH